MKPVTIVAEDKVGLLAEISYILAKSKINIESVNVDVVSKNAVISMSISDPNKGRQVLESAGYKVDTNFLVMRIKKEDVERIKKELQDAGVRISEFNLLCGDEKVQVYSLAVDKKKKAGKVLGEFLITNESDY
ncbi:hypothetical protein JXA56_05495 [Candidatus Micrarchaeota archaeon]|nr:hypothetical protein [Candidatus Micrarchaeota archaeon]